MTRIVNPGTAEPIDCSRASELLRGAVDLHCHVNPHVRPEIHSQTALEYAREASAAGMRAIVLKDIGLPTTGTAAVVNAIVDGIEVFGSLVLNRCNGGICPEAVATALGHGAGARIVYMPTGDALNHAIKRERFYAGVNPPVPRDRAITILDGGKLIPEVYEVLDLIAKADRCLATAHLSPPEIMPLVEAARERGVKKIIVSHALWQMVGLSPEQLRQLAAWGAFIEIEICLYMPLMHFIHGEAPLDPRLAARTIREIGAERVILDTDLGQAYAPVPVEGYRMFLAALLKCGVREPELRAMACDNPAALLGLPPEGPGALRS
jgi:hypothetical protein